MPTVENALQLLNERRFAVIPLHSPDMDPKSLPDFVRIRVTPGAKEYNERDVGKMPLVAWDEWKARLPKEAEVEGWWKKFPGANIGVTCGEHSGVFVVDADNEDALRYMESLGVVPGLTLTARTGRGYQFYFKWPGFEVSNSLGQIMPGLDIKGSGGYVVAPPSRHRLGVDYAWIEGVDEPMPAPEDLLEFIRQQAHRKTQKQALPASEIERMFRGPIVEPNRHPTAKMLIPHWVALQVPERPLREMASSWAHNACTPSLPEHEVQKIVDWALGEEAKKKRNPEEPKMERQGDDFLFSWPDLGIRAELTGLHRYQSRIRGDINVSSEATGTLHWGSITLQSSSDREELVHPSRGKLTRIRNDINWGPMLEHICKAAADAWLRGEATAQLTPAKSQMTRDIQTPIIPMPENETTVLFADGGSGKSLLALFICLMSDEPCLYLDWESNIEEHQDRLRAILRGLARTGEPTHIHYRRMARPIDEEAQFVRKEIARLGIRRLIVDSYGPASVRTGDWTDSAVRTMDTIRSLGKNVTRLLLTHISKDSSGQSDGAGKPIASVYVPNLARSSWEMRQGDNEGDEDYIEVRLDHRKVNRGRKYRPRAFRVGFVEAPSGELDSIIVQSIDYKTIILNGHQPIADRVELFLQSKGGDAEIKEIAEALSEAEDSIRKALKRKSRRFVQTKRGGSGPGDAASWGLRSDRKEEERLGYVYFIQTGESPFRLKVGWSYDPESRLRELQIGSAQHLSLAAMRKGDEKIEQTLQKSIEEWHISGEWYKDEPKVREILGLPVRGDSPPFSPPSSNKVDSL